MEGRGEERRGADLLPVSSFKVVELDTTCSSFALKNEVVVEMDGGTHDEGEIALSEIAVTEKAEEAAVAEEKEKEKEKGKQISRYPLDIKKRSKT